MITFLENSISYRHCSQNTHTHWFSLSIYFFIILNIPHKLHMQFSNIPSNDNWELLTLLLLLKCYIRFKRIYLLVNSKQTLTIIIKKDSD